MTELQFLNDGEGYTSSPHVSEALVDCTLHWRDRLGLLVADIFVQRVSACHKADVESMDGLELFMRRAPMVLTAICIRNGPNEFAVSKIQKMTDDLVMMHGADFAKRYGIEELYQLSSYAECGDQHEVSRHLNRSDAALAYFRSERGREDAEMFGKQFSDLSDAFAQLQFFTFFLLFIVSFVIAGPLTGLSVATRLILVGFGMLCVLGVFTRPIRLAYLPAPLRRYWLRSMPLESAEFVKHSLVFD